MVNALRNLLIISPLFLFCLTCSNSDDDQVLSLVLNVDREFALSSIDSITLFANAANSSGYRIEVDASEIEYFVNGNRLKGSIFFPDQKGTYELSAIYRDLESNVITVQVADLLEDMESLRVIHEGIDYLTTDPWSVSGRFMFEATLNSKQYSIENSDVTLFINGEPTNQYQHFYFSEAGTHTFHAERNGLKSNTIEIKVRPSKTFEEIVIPVVFHTYGIQANSSQLNKLIDTLNAVFNKSFYDVEDVIQRKVNPNAANFGIRFMLATEASEGFNLEGSGLDVIALPSETLPPLTYERFKEIEEENTWNTEKYINIWVTEFFNFELTNRQALEFAWGRGFANFPKLLNQELPGLTTVNSPDSLPPNNGQATSNGILLNGASVFGEHPDYIVSTIGHFLGLYLTTEGTCDDGGDFCNDTPRPGISPPDAPLIVSQACTGYLFTPTNFMAFGRNYQDLTYDQRERVRLVLEHGIGRPKNN